MYYEYTVEQQFKSVPLNEAHGENDSMYSFIAAGFKHLLR